MVSVSAVTYTETSKDIPSVLKNSTSEINPSKLAPNEILIKALGTPINPSDWKLFEGSYKAPIAFKQIGQDPDAPKVAVGGNEGVFSIVAKGDDVSTYNIGDWVILKLTGFGTWRTYAIVAVTEDNKDPLIVVLKKESPLLTLDEASTISTNPSTAYQLFTYYIKDWNNKGNDWIVTNAGNSFVNKYLFQIARHFNVKTLATVRDKPNWNDIEKELTDLGATVVVKEEDFVKETFITEELPKIIGDGKVRLALDSLGGPTTLNLTNALSQEGTFVNYGALAGGLVLFSPGAQLHKNFELKSYWLTRNTRANPQSKVDTVHEVLDLFRQKVFKPVKFTHYDYKEGDNLRDIFVRGIENSKNGKIVVVYK
ncbi:CIC11C00000000606 [Sungouiella intermedia]|uniref:CIC11C00000000606 n=1 Tax=Sungouiella intermedia TaxID=45354 RepID=A0A1L0BM40_9ASCO|nr:CIC11C00000000606 [[Candida] intermedia]